MTGLEVAAAAAAKAVAQRAGREWLAARAEKDQQGRELSELIKVSFPDRFAQRKLERQLADIADSVRAAARRANKCGVRRAAGQRPGCCIRGGHRRAGAYRPVRRSITAR